MSLISQTMPEKSGVSKLLGTSNHPVVGMVYYSLLVCLGHPISLPYCGCRWHGVACRREPTCGICQRERRIIKIRPSAAAAPRPPRRGRRPCRPQAGARADRRNRSYFLSEAILSHLFSAECEEEEENMERRADGQENPFSSGGGRAPLHCECRAPVSG